MLPGPTLQEEWLTGPELKAHREKKRIRKQRISQERELSPIAEDMRELLPTDNTQQEL